MKNKKLEIEKLEKVPVQHYPTQVIEKPLVSVCVQTYQHVSYIKECLDSILMQKANFDFEILIGEDESTDGTREICIEYAKKYPNKIRLFLHKRENVIHVNNKPSGRFNMLYNLNKARGKYIALCEGDDYWTDSLKLQKQVDFLESNSNYKLSFHRSLLLKGDKKEVFKIPDDQYSFKFSDLIGKNNFIATCSVVFRKPKDFQIPDWFYSLPFADLALYYLIVNEGEMYCLPEFMSVYRIHDNGLWSGSSEMKKFKTHIDFLDKMIPSFTPELKAVAVNKKYIYQKQIARLKYPGSRVMRKLYSLSRKYI